MVQPKQDEGSPGRVRLTPAMEQYYTIKEKYPDTIVFFHMGDFYETFGSDAEVVSRELDIVLTSRSKDREGNRMPLAGVPCHAVEGYIARMVGKGYRVAIADQLEDPKLAKGVVKRDVVRVITPGTVIDSGMLRSSGASFLMAIAPDGREDRFGAAFLDVSTGEFFARVCSGDAGAPLRGGEIPPERSSDPLVRVRPAGIVTGRSRGRRNTVLRRCLLGPILTGSAS